MITLTLIPLAAWAIMATMHAVATDGYRAVPFNPNYDTRTGSAAPGPLGVVRLQ